MRDNRPHAFDVLLKYQAGKPPVRPSEDRPGEYLGSGTGTIVGPALRGTVEWDLNEHTGRDACRMYFSGVIRTDDGALIMFDTLGFGSVPDPSTAPTRWTVAAAAQFESSDPRHAWLTTHPMTWVGEFDARTYEHRYTVGFPGAQA